MIATGQPLSRGRFRAAEAEYQRASAAVAEAVHRKVRSSKSIEVALAEVARAVSACDLTTEQGKALSAEVLREGVRSAEYKNYTATLRKKCEEMREPLLANAVVEAEIRSQRLAEVHATDIRRSVLRLGGRPPGLRVRWARWVARMNERIQKLDREVRAQKETTEADSSDDELEAKRRKSRLSNRQAVIAWIAMLSLVGFLIWAPWHIPHDPNVVKAAQDIELMSRRVIPAGTIGIRFDDPCPLIDRSSGVTVSFRIGDQDIGACVRESMITR
jgi:hypothetical protein